MLEVFYSDFVSRLVFSGDQVSNDQQKELCSLLVGRTAVAEGRRLAELRDDLNAANARMLQLEKGIKSHIQGPIEVADFLKLPVADGIEQLVSEAEQKLSAAKDPAALLSKPVPETTPFADTDDGMLLEALGRSIDDVSADAIARVNARLADSMGDDGERWLRQGMGYIVEGRCPFCDQSLDASEFFIALQQYFGQAYMEYERTLEDDLSALESQFDPVEFERAAERLQRQRAVAAAWVGQVASLDGSALSGDVQEAVKEGIEACAAVRELVSIKRKNPLRAVDVSSLKPRLGCLEKVLAALRAADQEIEVARREIIGFQESVRASNPEILSQELCRLRNHRTRHDCSVAALCDEYEGLVGQKEQMVEAQQGARERMKRSMETLLKKYGEEMNAYLEHFGSVIRIENPRTNYQTKPPSVEYSLNIDGIRVPLGRPTARSDVAWFGNTLSEGEKNLFALSFFLAHVKSRQDLSQVVVVVDDPVNSLDQERRLMIAETLAGMLNDLAQVVVLTHEPRLAYMLYRSQANGQCKMLCIRKEDGSSCIREWDSMDRDLATDYFRNYFTIADFLAGKATNWKDVARSLRPFLENYLRQRFPGEFEVEEWLGQMADRINDAGVGHPLAAMKPKLADIRLIATASNPTHHGSTHSPGAERLNSSSTEIYAKKALNVIS